MYTGSTTLEGAKKLAKQLIDEGYRTVKIIKNGENNWVVKGGK